MHFTLEQRQSWLRTTRDSAFNRWLAAAVNRGDGTLDLRALHALAASYGIDANAYAHLNPGQQRMNVGNRLRRLVPESIYRKPTDTPIMINPPPGARPESETSAPIIIADPLLADLSASHLMRLQSAIIDELRRRKIVRTANAPLGDYAEHLFARAFSWMLETNSAAGFDASDPITGRRYQIKARRLSSDGRGSRQLSAIRALPEGRFDDLAAVLFEPDFTVRRAALIPIDIVRQRAGHVAHVNGWRFALDDAVWSLNGVIEVTNDLRRAHRECG